MADMRSCSLLFVGSLAIGSVACAASNANAPEKIVVPPPQPVEIAKVEPPPEIPAPPPVPVPPRPDEEPETIPLSGAWAASFGHTAPFAEALANAHKTRDAFLAASKPLTTLDAPAEFQKVNALIDLLNRRFAAAYFAPNATEEERIAVLEEAASTLLAWARRLDEAGLAVTPAKLRTDPRVALTFEEVTEGPAKRWRNEGYHLSKLCVERAATDHVDNAATKSCRNLQNTYKLALANVASPPKTKAPAECACNPGDPLCSSTMNGWCRPTK